MDNDDLMVVSAAEILKVMDKGLLDDLEIFYDEWASESLVETSRIVRGMYELSFLGEGKSGYVLKIVDLHLGTPFAIKIGYLDASDNRRNYVADGWIGSGLSDVPNIVNVYGYDERFCLMEYIGGELACDFTNDELVDMDYLGKMERLIREVYRYGYGVFDLHLDNVIVDASYDFRVIDVGGYSVLSENDVSLEAVLEEFAKDSENMRKHRDFGPKWYMEWD